MTVRCSGKAKILIPETGEVLEVSSGDLEWEIGDNSEERSMGAEVHYYSSICLESEQGNCVEAEWDVWEYPIGSIESAEVEIRGGELLEDFDDIWSASLDDDYDPYEDQLDAILSNTEFYRTFSDEIASLRVLNSLVIDDLNAQRTLKKQVHIGTIACLETYLSDAFINTVLSAKSYLRSFFASFKDFKAQKLGMNELLERADQAEEIAKKAMLEVIYHNLAKVSEMYKSTLVISFPDFSEVQKDVGVRHDLVHRNGKTKKGEEIYIDTAKADELIDRVVNFVDQIDRELRTKEQHGEKTYEEEADFWTDIEDF
jgi:hypothetical protein